MVAITWRVDELTARRGWSVGRLAEVAGLDQKTVRKIVTGQATRVDLDTVARLCRALGVAPGALWRVQPTRTAAWDETAGVVGHARPEELREVLTGEWSERTDPGFERAVRDL